MLAPIDERRPMKDTDLQTLADAYAFIGNSLLKPMTQTEPVGLDPAFWDAFPDFGSAEVAAAVGACRAFAEEAQDRNAVGEDMVERVSMEFTKLFVGPPSPSAPPWETMNREEGVTVGFGQPTFAMQDILRDMGLRVSNENNQYADHMGIELLALSEMCRRAEGDARPESAVAFIEARPAGWAPALHGKVHEAYPGGYFDSLLTLAEALLQVR